MKRSSTNGCNQMSLNRSSVRLHSSRMNEKMAKYTFENVRGNVNKKKFVSLHIASSCVFILMLFLTINMILFTQQWQYFYTIFDEEI